MNRAWIELDKEALKHNVGWFQKMLSPQCKIMGVVKANAYGHGANIIANYLEKIGIHSFAVATVEEGVALRQSGVNGQILILGYTSLEKVMDLLQYQLTQTVVDAKYANDLNLCCQNLLPAFFPSCKKKRLLVHVALDTGMHRIGLPPDDIDAIEKIYHLLYLKVTGIFSHLCVADSDRPEEISFSQRQIALFFNAIKQLRSRGITVSGIHIQNSYACVNYTMPQPCDYARLGILMFGVRSSKVDYLAKELPLKPVLSLRAHITSVRQIGSGETVKYGRTYRANGPTTIAAVAIGYADGIPRTLSGTLRAIVHGRYVHVVGRICMDQLMIDVSDVPNVRAGDIVTFIGTDGKCQIHAEELAELAGTITNELLSRLGSRVENHGFQINYN